MSENIDSVFFDAVTTGNFEVAKYLLDAGADINYVDEEEFTDALSEAIDLPSIDAVKFLIENGVKITNEHIGLAEEDNCDEEGRTIFEMISKATKKEVKKSSLTYLEKLKKKSSNQLRKEIDDRQSILDNRDY